MTFRFVTSGLEVSGGTEPARLIIGTVDFNTDGGDLVHEVLRKKGALIDRGDAATGAGDGQVVSTSDVDWIFHGWQPRIATVDLLVTGPDRGDHLQFLLKAYYGGVPQEHRLVGDRTGGAFDSPVVMRRLRWRWPQTPDELYIKMVFRELKPQITVRTTAPEPVTPRTVDPPPDAAVLTDDDLARFRRLAPLENLPQPQLQ